MATMDQLRVEILDLKRRLQEGAKAAASWNEWVEGEDPDTGEAVFYNPFTGRLEGTMVPALTLVLTLELCLLRHPADEKVYDVPRGFVQDQEELKAAKKQVAKLQFAANKDVVRITELQVLLTLCTSCLASRSTHTVTVSSVYVLPPSTERGDGHDEGAQQGQQARL